MELEKKLSELKPIMLNCNKFSIYDYPESYTITELLCEFFTAINACIKVCNKTIELADWLVNEGLSQEVAKKLDTWLKDGTLSKIINETIFNELNSKVSGLTDRVDKHDTDIENIETILNNKGYINVKDFGAIGDGSSHPLSEKFESLIDAQKVFPKAVTLGEEIDRHAIQKVIDSGKACYIPTGEYIIDKQIDVDRAVDIYGDGRKHSILKCLTVGDKCFYFSENSHRSSFKKIGVFATLKSDLVCGSNNQITCFYVDAPYINFDDYEIHNFNYGFFFNSGKCFVHRITKGYIVYCNHGIYGNEEFNDIFISMNNITYCKIGVFKGMGRSVTILGNDIERNNISVQCGNSGDINIVNNYFELEKDCAIDIIWASSAVDRVTIMGNSFFSETNPSYYIRYHAREDSIINIANNNFIASTGVDKVVNVLKKGSEGTLCKPIVEQNYLNEKVKYGIEPPQILILDFNNTTMGNHLEFISGHSDLSQLNVNRYSGIRLTFRDSGQIKLPRFNNSIDPSRCFKLVAFGSGSSNMTIDTSTHEVVGLSTIEPNQIYSIYFNRVVGSKEEVLICKG